MLAKAKPVYEEMSGWREDLSGARTFDALSEAARRYVERLGQLSGVKLVMLGVGASREATIVLENPFRT